MTKLAEYDADTLENSPLRGTFKLSGDKEVSYRVVPLADMDWGMKHLSGLTGRDRYRKACSRAEHIMTFVNLHDPLADIGVTLSTMWSSGGVQRVTITTRSPMKQSIYTDPGRHEQMLDFEYHPNDGSFLSLTTHELDPDNKNFKDLNDYRKKMCLIHWHIRDKHENRWQPLCEDEEAISILRDFQNKALLAVQDGNIPDFSQINNFLGTNFVSPEVFLEKVARRKSTPSIATGIYRPALPTPLPPTA